MVSVLFVCLGNICRSPMAEAIFRDLVKKEGLEGKIKIDSAGTGDWHIGHPPHQGTRDILKKYQVSDEGILARQIVSEDLGQFDYIIGMDDQNITNIQKLGDIPSHVKVKRLMDFVEDSTQKEVPDPYYTGKFDEVYELVTAGCSRLLEEIKTELSHEGK
ncbi:low molecular weight protein-tyrosine-phosphatase [Niallia sp. XMNu-256]|uniref:low molecular weight protein-tyrosine-phosphatase n=1 Tax=Niallia sp. XMNu-256 TaxID=3082444 RepID=UPI0030CE32A8